MMRHATRPRLFAAATAALALALSPAPAAAQPTEQAVKAAFLPKFARYVRWPRSTAPGPGRPYHLCVIGRDPFGRLLDQAAAREVIDGRAVVVRRLGAPGGAAGACHVAFVQGRTPAETSRFLLVLRGQPILTVTDGRAGPQRGMVHFTVAGGRVRFFIDDAAAGQHGLAISSRLLALALGVRLRRS